MLEAILLIIAATISAFITFFIIHKKRQKVLYISFILIIGFFASWFTHTLVLSGYLAFPWRPFSSYTLNNIVYDLLFLPSTTLLFIWISVTYKRYFILSIWFAIFKVIQDYLLIKYTLLLEFISWTLLHTFISSFIFFYLYLFLYIHLVHRIQEEKDA